jgi:hypothetical protein
MSRDYPERVIKDQARGMLQNDPHFFYTQDILNYRGNTLDTKRPYSEVIAEELLNSYQEIEKIGNNVQLRKKTFKASHKGIPSVGARLRRFGNLKFSEKLLAIALNNSDANYCFGKILDYEVPLKKTRIDKFGKIDLIALEESTHSIKLVELKIRKTEGTDETLLRAILEIYTYYKLIVNSLNKFLKDYELSNYEYSHF